MDFGCGLFRQAARLQAVGGVARRVQGANRVRRVLFSLIIRAVTFVPKNLDKSKGSR